MLDQFCAILAAINPEQDCYRAYRIEAGTDLLGEWLVEVTFGRIGRAGHQLRFCVSDETAARKLVKAILARRGNPLCQAEDRSELRIPQANGLE